MLTVLTILTRSRRNELACPPRLPGEPLSGVSGSQEAAEIPRKQGISPDADGPDDPDTE